ncbi:hypothetical protein PFICI_07444 [Pestalotiopsis fici W106-1]|uniref:F-box domain-containing protein n=1 Tax=Pestalotiopsis fici (strain W106-1 / CGMCC3.15140) TaxID=1229662 RepID=W3X1G0_PESFW|nr:uncharacterized protein PFICI_07444 [Pestalotiopsis fici W106-1]ETS79915.1 hypothetical protein PFICI_07444 [Pestalotiopsis fici W106-1]
MDREGSKFPQELWLEICNLLESEYINTDAKDDGAQGIVSGLSSLSRACRGLLQILQPVLYKTPVLIGVRSLELFFRTIVEQENLASLVQTVRWYEGEESEVDRLIEEENLQYRSYRMDEDETENEKCFDWGSEFKDKYNAKLHLLRFDLYENTTRGSIEYMHQYPQILPLFLPNLQALDYRHDPRTHGFSVLSIYEYRSQQALPGLRHLNVRAGPRDNFNLGSYATIFRLSRDTLEHLHFEWPFNVNEVGTWPPEPEFHHLKTLSVHQGCLGTDSFRDLLFHSPSLEEFVYRSAREKGDDVEVTAIDEGDEEQLTWTSVHEALSLVRDTLRVLELDLHARFYKGRLESSATFTDFKQLHSVTLSQDMLSEGSDIHSEGSQLLVEILPKTLKHFGLTRITHDCPDSSRCILGLAEAVCDGKFPDLETIRLDMSQLMEGQTDEYQGMKEMFGSRGVRVI